MSEEDKKIYRAERHRGLEPEIVEWRILTKADLEEIDRETKAGKYCMIHGLLEPGLVLVVNHHNAGWTMTVEDFDANYKAV